MTAGMLEHITYKLLDHFRAGGCYAGDLKMPLRARLQAIRGTVQTSLEANESILGFLKNSDEFAEMITRTRNVLAHSPLVLVRDGERRFFAIVHTVVSAGNDVEFEIVTYSDLKSEFMLLEAYADGIHALCVKVENQLTDSIEPTRWPPLRSRPAKVSSGRARGKKRN